MLKSLFRQLFVTPSIEELAARELDEARRALLKAETAVEWAEADRVFQQARIERLEQRIQSTAERSSE